MISGSSPSSGTSSSEWSLNIATIWGIPIVWNFSAFLTLILVTCSYSWRWQATQSDWSLSQVWITSFVTAVLLFGSVLLHELAHSFIARQQGIEVGSITLFLLGGLAAIQRESRTRLGTVQLALAGPLASLAIAGCFWLLSFILPEWGSITCAQLAKVNAILGAFNLIPILPLDGGHVLTALIWKITGDRLRGVNLAAQVGRFLGGAAIGIGLAFLVAQNETAGGWIALVGWFIFRNAGRYQALANLQQVLLQLRVQDLPIQEGRGIKADLTVQDFVQQYLTNASVPIPSYVPSYLVIGDESSETSPVSWLDLEKLQALERSQWSSVTLASFTQPTLQLSPDLTLSQAILLLDAQDQKKALISPQNQPLDQSSLQSESSSPERSDPQFKWVDCGCILEAIATQLKLTISEADIEQTRITALYPATLNLKAIAEALDWMESTTTVSPA